MTPAYGKRKPTFRQKEHTDASQDHLVTFRKNQQQQSPHHYGNHIPAALMQLPDLLNQPLPIPPMPPTQETQPQGDPDPESPAPEPDPAQSTTNAPQGHPSLSILHPQGKCRPEFQSRHLLS